MSKSTTGAEYKAIGHAAREGVWIQILINKLAVETTGVNLKGGNKGCLNFKPLESQHHIKHIAVRHDYFRALVSNQELEIEWIPSAMMLADGMAEAFTVDLVKKHRASLGLVQ